MLLNNTITIEVTNDGKSNTVALNSKGATYLMEIITSLELAKNSLMSVIEDRVKSDSPKGDFKEWLNNLKIEDLDV